MNSVFTNHILVPLVVSILSFAGIDAAMEWNPILESEVTLFQEVTCNPDPDDKEFHYCRKSQALYLGVNGVTSIIIDKEALYTNNAQQAYLLLLESAKESSDSVVVSQDGNSFYSRYVINGENVRQAAVVDGDQLVSIYMRQSGSNLDVYIQSVLADIIEALGE